MAPDMHRRPPVFPSNVEQLRSILLCPYCLNYIRTRPICTSCGLDLSTPELNDVHQASLRAAQALEARAVHLTRAMEKSRNLTTAPPSAASIPPQEVRPPAPAQAAVRTAAPQAITPPQQPLTPAPAHPFEAPVSATRNQQLPAQTGVTVAAQAPHSGNKRRPMTIPVVLLTVGVTFLGVAAAVFLTVAFFAMSMTTKALITAGITGATMLLASFLRRRNLTATAEGIAILGSALAVMDVWAIHALNFFGAGTLPATLYWGIALLVLSFITGAWGWVSKLRAATISSALFVGPAAVALITGIFNDLVPLPALIPAGIASIIAISVALLVWTGKTEGRWRGAVEQVVLVASTHIASAIGISYWWVHSSANLWVLGMVGLVIASLALVAQVRVLDRIKLAHSGIALCYSGAALAGLSWILAMSMPSSYLAERLSWVGIFFSVFAWVGIFAGDALSKRAQRGAGVVAMVLMGIAWLPAAFSALVKVGYAVAMQHFGRLPVEDWPYALEMLSAGGALLVTAGAGWGLYRALALPVDPAQPASATVLERSLPVVAAAGIVLCAYSAPVPISVALLTVAALGSAFLGLLAHRRVNIVTRFGTALFTLASIALLMVASVPTVTFLTSAGIVCAVALMKVGVDWFHHARSGSLLHTTGLGAAVVAVISACAVALSVALNRDISPEYVFIAAVIPGVLLWLTPLVMTYISDKAAPGALGVLTTGSVVLSAVIGGTLLMLEDPRSWASGAYSATAAGVAAVGVAIAVLVLKALARRAVEPSPLWALPLPVWAVVFTAGIRASLRDITVPAAVVGWVSVDDVVLVLALALVVASALLWWLNTQGQVKLAAAASIVVAGQALYLVAVTAQIAWSLGTVISIIGLIALAVSVAVNTPLIAPRAGAGVFAACAIVAMWGYPLAQASLPNPLPVYSMILPVGALIVAAVHTARRPDLRTAVGNWVMAALGFGTVSGVLVSVIHTSFVVAGRVAHLWVFAALLVAAVVSVSAAALRVDEDRRRFGPLVWALQMAVILPTAGAIVRIGLTAPFQPYHPVAVFFVGIAMVVALIAAFPAGRGRLKGLFGHWEDALPDTAVRVGDVLMGLPIVLGVLVADGVVGSYPSATPGALTISCGAGFALAALLRAFTGVNVAYRYLPAVVSGACMALGSMLLVRGGDPDLVSHGLEHLQRGPSALVTAMILSVVGALAVLVGAIRTYQVGRAGRSSDSAPDLPGAVQPGSVQPGTAWSSPAYASAVPLAVWSAIAVMPMSDRWTWWALAWACAIALLATAAALMLRRHASAVSVLWSAISALMLPLVALLAVGYSPSRLGWVLLVSSAGGLLVLFAVPRSRVAADVVSGLRAVFVAVALCSSVFIGIDLPAQFQPLATIPAVCVTVATAVGLMVLGRQPLGESGGNAGTESRIYWAVSFPMMVLPLLVGDMRSYQASAHWWALGFAVALGAATVALSGWMFVTRTTWQGPAVSSYSPGLPVSFRPVALPTMGAAFGASLAFIGWVKARVLFAYAPENAVVDIRVDGAIFGLLALMGLLAYALHSWSLVGISAWYGRVSGTIHGVMSVVFGIGLAAGAGAYLRGHNSAWEYAVAGGVGVLVAIPVLIHTLADRYAARHVDISTGSFVSARSMFIGAWVLALFAGSAAGYGFLSSVFMGGQPTIDWYVLPLGLVLVLLASVNGPSVTGWSSWYTWSGALLVALGIPLINELVHPTAWGIAVLTAVIVLVIVLGAVLSLQAPLLAGAGVAVVHAVIAIRTAVPELSVPWWVWLSIAGAVLVFIASTYEARMKDARRLGQAVRRLG